MKSDLPWDIDKTGYYIGKVYIGGVIEVAQMLDMPNSSAGNREANAAFIVHCVNNHEKLVEACKVALKVGEVGNHFDSKTFEILRQTIQSAEER